VVAFDDDGVVAFGHGGAVPDGFHGQVSLLGDQLGRLALYR
jgi:hypothetical protein